MFNSAYRAIAVCLIVVFAASGIIRASNTAHPCMSSVHTFALSGMMHAGHPHPRTKQPIKESTAKCCGLCVVASVGMLQGMAVLANTMASRADYWIAGEHFASRWSPLDPEIPKQFS